MKQLRNKHFEQIGELRCLEMIMHRDKVLGRIITSETLKFTLHSISSEYLGKIKLNEKAIKMKLIRDFFIKKE